MDINAVAAGRRALRVVYELRVVDVAAALVLVEAGKVGNFELRWVDDVAGTAGDKTNARTSAAMQATRANTSRRARPQVDIACHGVLCGARVWSTKPARSRGLVEYVHLHPAHVPPLDFHGTPSQRLPYILWEFLLLLATACACRTTFRSHDRGGRKRQEHPLLLPG